MSPRGLQELRTHDAASKDAAAQSSRLRGPSSSQQLASDTSQTGSTLFSRRPREAITPAQAHKQLLIALIII